MGTETKPGDPRIKVTWLQERAVVVGHAQAGPDWYKLTLRSPEIAARGVAGHFVEVAVHPVGHSGHDPLLRRPFSICELRPQPGLISVIYRAGGRGTRALARVSVGQELELLGPLGYSFPDPRSGQGRLVLVGGGVGIPPMVAAAEWAQRSGRAVAAVIGARSAGGLAGGEELQAAGAPVTVCTDDGSAGRRALVVEPLRELIAAGGVGEVWACGPEPMLAAVRQACAAAGVPCWLSLERYMACGFGACMSCTVERAGGEGYAKYMRCCVDGPVFRAEEVAWNGER